MKLHRSERDTYVLTITVEPELTGDWEASFDDGETWVQGAEDSGSWVWLVAGPDFVGADVGMDDDDTDATIEGDTIPMLRIKDDPVLDVQPGPRITIWGSAPSDEE